MVADNQKFPGTKYTFGQMREMCRENKALFSMVFFPHHVIPSIGVPRFHEEMHELTADRGNRYVLIIAPRGFAKTTRIVFIDTLHDVAYNNEQFVVLTSKTTEMARTYLWKIKYELELNDLFRATYGNFVTRSKWTQDDIVLGNGIKIVAKGAGKQIRGAIHGPYRPTKIVVDDPEDIESVDSDGERQRIRNWFEHDVCYCLAQGGGNQLRGRVIVVGTIIHSDCLVANLQNDSRFKTLFTQAIIQEEGREKSLWPQYISLAELQEEKEKAEERGRLHVWMMERMNLPLAPEDRLVRESDLREWDGNYSYQNGVSSIEWGNFIIPVEVVTSVDLASREKAHSDFTVINTTGMDAKNNLYEIDYWRKRETNPVFILVTLLLHVGRFHPSFLVIETTAFQQMFSRLFMYFRNDKEKLRTLLEMEKVSDEDIRMVLSAWLPPVIEVNPTRNKVQRIMGLQPRFRMHQIFHRPFMRDFVNEATRFPEAKHDDIMDALQMCDAASHGAAIESVEIKETAVPRDAFAMRDGRPPQYTTRIRKRVSRWVF